MLKDAVYPLCTIHNMDFGDMVGEHEMNHFKSLVQAVEAVLADPSYNVRRVREDEHSGYDLFSAKDMKFLDSFCKYFMKLAAHRHMF